MKKLILTLVLAVCSFQVGFSQYDEVTESKIKVKFFAAQELLENSEYSKAIEKVKEIEELTGGPKSSVVQNIKVKSYLGLGKYKEAKEELNILYKLSPTDEILKDIASYEDEIVKNIWDVEKIKKIREQRSKYQDEARSIFANKKYGEDNNVKEKYDLFKEYIYLASCPTHDFCDFKFFGTYVDFLYERDGDIYANMFIYHNITPIWQEINMIDPSDVEKVTLSIIDEGFKIRIFASSYKYKKQKRYASYDDNEWEDKNINFSVNCSSIEDARILFGAIRSCLELSKQNIIYEDQTK